MKKFPIAERFTSLQGEGLYTGTLMHFIRFAGCSVGKKLSRAQDKEAVSAVGEGLFTQTDPIGELPVYREKCTTYDGREFLCFASGTRIPIVSDGKYIKKRAVGELSVGDKVLAWTKEGTVASRVLRVESRWVPESFLVTVILEKPAGGRLPLLVTKDHRFLDIEYRWISADRLTLKHQLHHGSQQRSDATRRLLSERRFVGIAEGTVTFNFSKKRNAEISKRMIRSNPMKDSSVVVRNMEAHWRRPTGPEKKVIAIASTAGLALTYTGANGKIIRASSGKIRNPDFVVPETSKVVEVYDSSFKYIGGKRDYRWEKNTKRWYSQCGYDCLILDVHKSSEKDLTERLVQFIGNGLKVKSIQEGVGKGFGRRWAVTPGATKMQNGERLVLVTELAIEHKNYLGPGGVVSHNCDTDFRTKEVLTLPEILAGVPKGVERLCFTGGEPMNQPLGDVLDFISEESQHKVHIETSGTVSMEDMWPRYSWQDNVSEEDRTHAGWLWITVSPKLGVLPEMIGIANEIKLLVDAKFDVKKVPDDILDHPLVWIQPINAEWRVDDSNMRKCIQLLHEHPTWRMSTQMHKIWKVR